MAELQYKTFSSLMNTVGEDLEHFSDNNLIKNKKYIKVARTCNSTLGIKINRQAEAVLTVENYRTDMPEDLLSIISALALTVEKVGTLNGSVHGTHTVQNTYEEIINKGLTPTTGCVNGCNECYWMTRQYSNEVLFKNSVYTLTPTQKSLKYFTANSPNKRAFSSYQIDVDERSLHFNFKEGTVHLAYLADMVDEEGELLILDHPLVNDYYEWAIKTQIFTNLWHNSDADVQQKMQDARAQLGHAKQRAVDIVATPEYKRLKQYTDNILRAYYEQYIKMFV